MAEDTLVKDVLSGDMIAAGQALTNTLEQRGFPFVAVFWLYDWENNRWNLVVASPLFDTAWTAAHKAVHDAVKASTPEVDRWLLRLFSDTDRNVRSLVELADEGLKLDGRRHRGRVVEDSYVYRVRPTAAVA